MVIKNWNWQNYKNSNKNRVFETVAHYLFRGKTIEKLPPKTIDTSFQHTQPTTIHQRIKELTSI